MSGSGKENRKKAGPKEQNNPARISHAEKGTLTPKDEVFKDEYLKHLNPRMAALAAGYPDSIARSRAYVWVSNPNAKPVLYKAIKAAMEERSIRTQITQDKVLERWWQIATADPNELMQLRRLNCRHCYGIDHHFQWKDEAEYEQALQAVIAEEKAMQVDMPEYRATYPTDEGGYGFIPVNSPNEECPHCFGEGKLDIYFSDTTQLSPQGQALFAGIKQTKEGLEVKTHDQLAALGQVARHLGMFNDKLTLRGDQENPLEVLLRSLPGNTLRPVEDENK